LSEEVRTWLIKPGLKTEMELARVPGTSLELSRVAIGTWAIGGWMWGGTDEAESIATIRATVEHGINVIDTAPAYGFGRSEEIVGQALAEGNLRSRVLIATKVGLDPLLERPGVRSWRSSWHPPR
jgi:aryl-alcohol dehydrogenase-like predicted oxidoreductase